MSNLPAKQRIPPKTLLKDPVEYRARALRMLELRVHSNMSIQEIATHFRVSVDTVERSLRFAKKEGMVDDLEARVVDELGELALEAYRTKLTADDPDMYVAKDVLDKIFKLGERHENRTTQAAEMSLRAYLEQKRNESRTSDTENTSDPAFPDYPIIDIVAIPPTKEADSSPVPSGGDISEGFTTASGALSRDDDDKGDL